MTANEMSMGQGLGRQPFSWAGWLYSFRAPRMSVQFPQGLFWSDVDVADVSFYQGEIDFHKMKQSGIKGVFIRAGQNLWVDKMFAENWRKAKEAGLPRGSYWFYDSRAEPKAQADLYRQTLGDDIGELPLVADWEENYKGQWGGWKNLYDFLERLKVSGAKITQDKIWIYTGYYYWMSNSPQNDPAALTYFSHYKLWLAWYTTNPANVRIPNPWKDAALWQWGTPAEGKERGVETTEIDMNKFTGTLDEFEILTGQALPIPSVPPIGEPMRYQMRTIDARTNIRPDHNTNNTALLSIPNANTLLEGDELFTAPEPLSNDDGVYQAVGDKWLKTTYNGVSGWVAYIHKGFLICKDFVDNEEPTPPPVGEVNDMPVTVILGDDVKWEKQIHEYVVKAK